GSLVSKELEDGPVYVSKNDVNVKKIIYYSYQWIDVSRFKSALFRDPQDVYHQGNYFTNGANSLKEEDHIIKYVNPGSGARKRTSIGEASIVRDSFDYINGHNGWTEDYILFDYKRPVTKDGKPKSGEVTFRMMMGDEQSYPV